MALEKGRNNPEVEDVIEGTRKEMQDLKHTVIAEVGKDKLFLKEDKGTIKIDNRTISFEGLFLQDKDGNEKRISKINNFYVKRMNDGLEIYSNGEQLPRLKLYNNGNVEGRSDPNNSNFDIKLDGYGTIFDSLRVELTNNYDKYKTPEKKMDFAGKGFSIEWGNKKFAVNAGNIYISGLKLYNSQTKKWENVQNITNMYVKRDNENNLTIYSSAEDKPKMVLKPNGIVKGVLPSNGDNLNYGAKEDTVLWRTIWGELNSKYSTYRHEDVASTSEPVLITYTTKDEPKRVSAPDGLYRDVDEHGNTIWVSGPIVADGRGNVRNKNGKSQSKPQNTERAELNNLEWKEANNTFRNVEVPEFVPESNIRLPGGRNIDLHISSVAKKGNTIMLNKGEIKMTYTGNSKRLDEEKMSMEIRTFDSSINTYHHVRWKYDTVELSNKGSSANKRRSIYNQLNREYFS